VQIIANGTICNKTIQVCYYEFGHPGDTCEKIICDDLIGTVLKCYGSSETCQIDSKRPLSIMISYNLSVMFLVFFVFSLFIFTPLLICSS